MCDQSPVPLPSLTVPNTLKHSSPTSFKNELTPPQKRKGKEREHDVVSSRKKYKQHSPVDTDVAPRASPDAFSEYTIIPLEDDDIYPPLTTLDLVTNTRFQFAHAWRRHASRLREAELDWMTEFKILGKACIWAQSMETSSSPRLPETAGFVSSEQLRPWELVLPESSPQEKNDDLAHTTQGHLAVEDNTNYPSLPDDALPGPSAAFDPVPSDSTVSQGPVAVDMEHDMNQFFNGLSDSPPKHVLPPAPTHTFRPHLLQSAGRAQMSALELGFPSLELDPRLPMADTGDHECFLGVPPSPPPAEMTPSTAPEPVLEPVNYFPASPSNIFDASPTWSFEQGESLLPDNDPPPTSDVTPITPGTINPSLLGLEQSQKPSQPPKAKDASPKRRSKLPEPVIYIRRPINSSSLPLLSGKRPVQIKYRDSGGSPATATPSTREGLDEAPSNSTKQSQNDTGDSLRAKRRSAPSRKVSAHHTATESDSDYIPQTSTSTSKLKIRIKRPSLRDKESVVEQSGMEPETVPAMTFCHQCRCTTNRPKMLCSNRLQDRVCGKRFCNRCILYRWVHSTLFAPWFSLIGPTPFAQHGYQIPRRHL